MVFTSQIFLFYFLPLVVALYYVLPRQHRNAFLAVSSYLFYGWWSPWFVGLMFLSTIIDWYAGAIITQDGASPRQRKAGVWLSCVVNLALLGFFKYFMFVQENVNRILEAVGAESTTMWMIILPAGISFYTFQSMSYSIDLYRGHATRASSFTDFACYVALFPQLIAGPIVRYQDLAEQLRTRPERGEQIREGVYFFMVGFTKKVLLANTISEAAVIAFDQADALGPGTAWFALLCFYFQLYFDFSGYSDMAVGLGKLFGFELPDNFRSPYKAESFTDFWSRWHLSLSTWLRDYVFIPLGGSRVVTWKTYRNIMITFVLGGLWHGAQWRFLIWGAWHGIMLSLERANGRGCLWWFLPKFARIAVTVIIFQFNWIIFRCETLSDGGEYLRAMFVGIGSPEAQAVTSARIIQPFYVACLIACAAVVWGGRETRKLAPRFHRSPLFAMTILGLFLWSVLAMFSQAENPFLYFRF